MFQAYRDDNEDAEVMFIHIFKRIETCERWAKTRVALAKAKEGVFDPTAVAPTALEGLPIGNKAAKLARNMALATKQLQSSIVKCNADGATREGKEGQYFVREEGEGRQKVVGDVGEARSEDWPLQGQCCGEEAEIRLGAFDGRRCWRSKK
jgi:hypothetical protein